MELFLSHRRLVFSRRTPDQWVIVAVSAEREPVDQEVSLPGTSNGKLVDLLNPGEQFRIKDGKANAPPTLALLGPGDGSANRIVMPLE